MITLGEQQRLQPPTNRQCIATARSTGKQCAAWALPGSPTCRQHTGPYHKSRLSRVALDRLGLLYDPEARAITDPVGELQRLGGIARHALDVCGDKINELQTWEVTDAKGMPHIKAGIQVMMQLMRICHDILGTLAKLGIDERVVQLREREQALVIAALRAIAGDPDLALTPAQHKAWSTVVPRHLRAITAANPTDKPAIEVTQVS